MIYILCYEYELINKLTEIIILINTIENILYDFTIHSITTKTFYIEYIFENKLNISNVLNIIDLTLLEIFINLKLVVKY